ncbi:MAG: DUF481 domain-containing protein [Planctomycetota bacterium]
MNKRVLTFAAVTVLSISGLIFAEETTIRLTNGDIVSGEVLSETDTEVRLMHPVFGEVTVPMSNIDAMGPEVGARVEAKDATQLQREDELEAAEEAEAADAVTAAVDTEDLSDAQLAHRNQKPGFFDGPFLRGYDKEFSLGLTGTDGNTETLAFVTQFTANSESEKFRTGIKANYFLTQDEGDRTRNEGRGQVDRDWLMKDSKWFAFGNAFYQYDEFEVWESRVGAFGGPGYTFYDSAKFRLLGRVGAGVQYEFGDVNELTPEALIGVEGHWQVAENQKFTFSNTLFPSLEDFFENRNVTELSYTIDLDRGDGMQISFGVLNEYESSTEGMTENNDLKYFAALGFEF